jgi:hypothetical protein
MKLVYFFTAQVSIYHHTRFYDAQFLQLIQKKVVKLGTGSHQEQRKEQAGTGKGGTASGKKRSETFHRSTCIKTIL